MTHRTDDREAGMNARTMKSSVHENAQAVVLALIAALCLKAFVFEHYIVPTDSMYPTIWIGDRLVAVKLLYGAKIPFTSARMPAMRKPEYGDIVVFRSPFQEAPSTLVGVIDPVVFTLSLGFVSLDPQPKFFVKRCIGLPGDKVEISAKRVYINGAPQKGWWPERHGDPRILVPPERTSAGGEGSGARNLDFFGPVTVPEGHCFVMGDNRDESFDSRYRDFLDEREIRAKAVFRIWTPSRAWRLR
jgi:signal peptidase I